VQVTFGYCRTCRNISVQLNKCEHCVNERLETWPAPEVTELLEHVGSSLDAANPDRMSLRVNVILTSIVFEQLLEDLLYVMAYGELLYDEVGILVEALMESHQGRNQRLRLYQRLGYGTFSEQAVEFGHPDFPARWERLTQLRNKFAHRVHPPRGEPEPLDLSSFIRDGLSLFMQLNNHHKPVWF